MDSRSIEYRRIKSRAYQKRVYKKPDDGVAATYARLRIMEEGAEAVARLRARGLITVKSQ